MNINNVKRALENAGIWYSVPLENDDINIDEVTTIPHVQSEMYKKLFVLTTGNIKEAERAVSDWSLFAKYLHRLNPLNLVLVGSNDIGKAVGVLHEALR